MVDECFPSWGYREASRDWFSEGVARTIGNGPSTYFWHDPWCGKVLLRLKFSRLFQLSLQQGVELGS